MLVHFYALLKVKSEQIVDRLPGDYLVTSTRMLFGDLKYNTSIKMLLVTSSTSPRPRCYLVISSISSQLGCYLVTLSTSPRPICYWVTSSTSPRLGCYLMTSSTSSRPGCYSVISGTLSRPKDYLVTSSRSSWPIGYQEARLNKNKSQLFSSIY